MTTMTQRPGILTRIHDLFRGMASLWLREREERNPQAVYEQAIAERSTQYRELKNAVAGILYMRNKLEADTTLNRQELARTVDEIRQAVRKGDDEAALTLIAHKQALCDALERTQEELGQVRLEAEEAKTNLTRFRDEIRRLEHEKVRSLATLANARARRRVQAALSDLSVEADMRALESVRGHVARASVSGQLEREIEGKGIEGRVKAIREDAKREAARRELFELKRNMEPTELPSEASRSRVIEAAPTLV